MAYALASDLIARFDARILGDVAEDTGTRVSAAGLLTDPNVLVALADGSSMIDAACQIGQRYTQAELAALSGTDRALLLRLNCDLSFCYLCQRRGMKPPQYDECYKRSEELLDRLKDGALIFNVLADVGAGSPSDQFPSQATYTTINLLRDSTNNRFYPVRRIQQPASGGYSGSN